MPDVLRCSNGHAVPAESDATSADRCPVCDADSRTLADTPGTVNHTLGASDRTHVHEEQSEVSLSETLILPDDLMLPVTPSAVEACGVSSPHASGRTPADSEPPTLLDSQGEPPTCAVGAETLDPALWQPSMAHGSAASPHQPKPDTHPLRTAPEGYEILGELGRGAMGVVYQARQKGLNRLVALKMVLAASRAGPDELARFQSEAEAVARLDHPNIVKVYEVGQYGGLPYMALEYVSGGNLAGRIASTPQPPRQAAAVVRALADAMSCAHRRGILHRDLKPANVLLAPVGDAVPGCPLTDCVPKITDFGLAKKLEGDAGQTRDGAILGTPSYMAPEQASGQIRTLGPPADVYALGAILYDLLTGVPPFRGETVMDTLQQVLHREPLPPARLHLNVPRDLETICLKCLQKEPGRRYQSAAELAEDLGRFLADEPIQARPAGPLERAAKWARRRPAAAALFVLGTLFVAATGAAGYLFAHWESVHAHQAEALRQEAELERDRARDQHRRAEDNFRQACVAVNHLLAQVGSVRLAHEPRLEIVRRELLSRAVRFYEGFLDEHGTDSDVRWQSARTCGQLALIEEMLGRHDRAEQRGRQALTLLSDLSDEFPDEPAYRAELASVHHNLGVLYASTGRAADAETSYRAALDLRQSQIDRDRQALATTYHNLGVLCQQRGDTRSATEYLDEARSLQRSLVEERPEVATHRQELARTDGNLARAYDAAGRPDDARQSAREGRDLLLRLVESSGGPEYRQELALACNQLGGLLRDVNSGTAEAVYREAIALDERLVADFPATPAYRQALAASLNNLGVLLQATGRRAEAEQAFARSLSLKERLASEIPWVPDHVRELAMGLQNRAVQLHTENRLPEAEPAYQRAADLLRKLQQEHPDRPEFRQELARGLVNQAAVLLARGQTGAAEKLYREGLELQARLVERFPDNATYRSELGRVHLNRGVLQQHQGKVKEAERSYSDARTVFDELARKYPDEPDHRQQRAAASGNLAVLLRDTKRGAQAEPLWSEADETLAKLAEEKPAVPGYRLDRARVLNEWALYLAGAGRTDEANHRWLTGESLLRELVKQHPDEAAYRQELARTMGNRGTLAAGVGRLDEAAERFREAAAVLESAEHPTLTTRRDAALQTTNLARVLAQAGDAKEAGAAWSKAVELRRALVSVARDQPAYRTELGLALVDHAAFLTERNRAADAAARLDEAFALLQDVARNSQANPTSRANVAEAATALADVRLRQGNHAAAAKAIDAALAATPAVPALAARLARCATLANEDATLPPADRTKLADAYAERAVKVLRDAAGQGFKDWDDLERSPEFAPLRERDDFKALVQEARRSR